MTDDCTMRVEGRYLLKENDFHALMKEMHGKQEPDSYSHYTVCDLYLRPEEYSSNQLSHTDTLRLRSYGIPQQGECVYLERTMQSNGLSCRRRIGLTLDEALQYIVHNSDGVALREQDAILHGENPKPEVLVAFERESYGFDALGTRLTIDRDVRFRTEALDLRLGDHGDPLIPKEACILGIKGLLPSHLLFAMQQIELQPVPFTKYGYAHIAALRKERRRSYRD